MSGPWSDSLDLELGVGNLTRALAIGQSLLRQRPTDVALRTRVARIAQWAGQPRLALTHWMQLAHTVASEEATTQAVTIARQLHEFDAVADVLARKSKQHCLKVAEINDLVDAQEALGEPESAIDALETYLKCHPKRRFAWDRLSVLQERIGDLDAALVVQHRSAQQFPADSKTIEKRAEILWQLNRPADALELLRRQAAKTPAEHKTFWELYARLAWELGAHRDAQQAYHVLWQTRSNDSRPVERLLPLVRASGAIELSMTIAEQSWREFHKPAYLIAAMEAAQQAQLWEELRRLEALALEEPHLFEGTASYWLLRGALANHEERPKDAKDHYEKALGLAPHSITARAAMLWLLIEQGTDDELAHRLRLWQTSAEKEPVLWSAFAIGYRRIELTREALFWYARQAAQQPQDYLWLLDYADALKEAGAQPQARRIDRYAIKGLRPAALEQLQERRRDPAHEVFLRRYTGLLREHLGAEPGERWLHALAANQEPSAVFPEFLVGWYLATDRTPAARRYVLRAHAHRLKLPSWQQLAVALHDEDQNSMERVLSAPAGLSVADRGEALRRLGYLDRAYAMASQQLGASQSVSEQASLRLQASQLATELPNGVSVEATVRNLGTLRLVETPVRLMTTHGPLGVRLTAGWIGLDADPTKLELRDADSEMSFEVVAERGWPQSTSMFLIGANLRQDKSLFPIAISHEHRFQAGVRGNASLAFNELSEESAAFRAEGKRDRFTLGLFGEPTRREYFAATLNGFRYLTRAGASLGKGIKLDLELGHRLWMRHPEWRLSVYGTSTWNDLRQNLPQDLAIQRFG